MATNNPVTTILQIGDILRFDGLATRGQARDHNRKRAWLQVFRVNFTGMVFLRVEEAISSLSSSSGGVYSSSSGKVYEIHYDRLVTMIEDGLYQVVEKVGD